MTFYDQARRQVVEVRTLLEQFIGYDHALYPVAMERCAILRDLIAEMEVQAALEKRSPAGGGRGSSRAGKASALRRL